MARLSEVRAGEATWGEYALDVLGHTGLGTAYALPFIALGLFVFGWEIPLSLLVGTGIALFGGIVREVVQYLKNRKLNFEDRFWDATQHILGGPLALGIVLIVRSLI